MIGKEPQGENEDERVVCKGPATETHASISSWLSLFSRTSWKLPELSDWFDSFPIVVIRTSFQLCWLTAAAAHRQQRKLTSSRWECLDFLAVRMIVISPLLPIGFLDIFMETKNAFTSLSTGSDSTFSLRSTCDIYLVERRHPLPPLRNILRSRASQLPSSCQIDNCMYPQKMENNRREGDGEGGKKQMFWTNWEGW